MSQRIVRQIIPTAGLGLAVLSSMGQRINVIYIMTDDHSYQTISAYDGRYNETPSLDRLAREGVRYDKCFVTNSLSGPSRAALLTGKFGHINGFINNSSVFDGSQQTFPKLLQKAGYQTAIIGKWHLVSEPTGFDYWDILTGQGSYYNPHFINKDRGTYQIEGYVTDIITDKSIDFLNRRDRSKPFCLLVHHKAVHRIWMSDRKHLYDYEDRSFPLPETFFDDYNGRQAASEQKQSIERDIDLAYDLKMVDESFDTRLKSAITGGELKRMTKEQRSMWDSLYVPMTKKFIEADLKGDSLTMWKYQRYMRDYLKSVASLDDNVGRLYDYLKENDLLHNTVVIYASDQGFYMGEHGWFDKRFIYEESLRTPLIIRLPDCYEKAKRNKSSSLMVQNLDFAPTMLDLCNVDIPSDIQGVSFASEIETGKVPDGWRKNIYYHYYEFPDEHNVHKHYGIRGDRYKLAHFYDDGIDCWELFDLKKDPDELTNLYGNPKYSEVQKKMHIELQNLRQQYKDTSDNR